MLHDCAYVGYELSRELTKLGVNVRHLLYHNKLGVNLKKGCNLMRMMFQAKTADCDLIHAHYLGVASTIAYLTGKPYIVHAHGYDVRGRNLTVTQKKVLNNAEALIYATPDMEPFVPKDSIYLPTPIGSQFKDLHKQRTIKTAYRPVAYETPLNADLMLEGYTYEEMPQVLNTIETFIDRYSIDSLSKTALEALACGCNVKQNGYTVHGLPEQHQAENVAKQLKSVYCDVLNA